MSLNFDLSQEQAMIRRLAREFAEGEVAPGAAERDKTGRFPLELVRKMGELGLMGIPYPEEYGGMGGDTVSYALAVEEISRVDGSLGITLAAHCSIGMGPVYYFGTEEQKQRWLPGAARGEYLASFGLTEPGAGSDSAGTKTTAVRDGDGWLLNGSKIFITNAAYCGYIVCTAVTRPGEGHKGISAFIVPNPTPGFTIGPAYDKMGLRSSDTRPLYFEDVRLPADALLGKEGEGFRQFMVTLDGGRISIGAMAVGIAQGALDAALAYARQRVQFGQPISKFQAIQFKLADMAMEIELARNMVLKAAWLKDQGRPFTREAAMAKLFASETAVRAANQAIQIHGGMGYMEEMPVSRFWRDAKLTEIGEGTSEIQRLVIARQMGC
ncbi:alkylation response protein AidB-like acyl-CoA dehydrogenase [Symbiobacterium terraclitae]|uniref:Alkylation response protein AidB-like acyl-CoA dehydrogenase n=1 Tax=Symbiobacterium terraclitae TaxID=557451 RepID=A0ABS4JPY3_9FIRM|nr:acyl-CoA dehydrogenase [Symbiobacterium terraclitae]MBP2017607.1 alkylation response protein AidB-like acyl-CoA dehydrogenase [Symbiobacterium terraclitae]